MTPGRKKTDISPFGAALWFLPVSLRVPLKFGAETVRSVTVARVRLKVRNQDGNIAEGWGETPLSPAWVWPGPLSYECRDEILREFCLMLARAWSSFGETGHAMEIGHHFNKELPTLLAAFNAGRQEQIPLLGALVCCAAFDLALHDAYGVLNRVPTYSTYNARYMSRDLSTMIASATDTGGASFRGLYPEDFLSPRKERLVAWHLVGGEDPVHPLEIPKDVPNDGYPVSLRDWIQRDKLQCLKIKLRGVDSDWDYQRLEDIGNMAIEEGVHWLSADFNCMVTEPSYVNKILDRLLLEHPRIYGMLLYIEQPFPYDLEAHRIDVRSVSARKPLLMDESAHEWQLVRLGRDLGWSGVALKTCKTQTGAILSLCWAKAHGMSLMVQDLTNPMLALVSHASLGAYAGGIIGIETNAMQFYPDASLPEEQVHPGLFKRCNGMIDLTSVHGAGLGYRIAEIRRELPPPAIEICGN